MLNRFQENSIWKNRNRHQIEEVKKDGEETGGQPDQSTGAADGT